jgi:hypothetical protein
MSDYGTNNISFDIIILRVNALKEVKKIHTSGKA